MRIQKKNESGAATNYISRRAALRKLQLSLKDFRRLCILKGIYPHEPKHVKKVNKGSSENKTWYYTKDIHFLAHEPIINKFREYKIFLRKFKKYKEKRDKEAQNRLLNHKPKYKLDHIVQERYPSLADAIRDLDDALCMIFLFARMPTSKSVKSKTVHLCRRFSIEFLHYVIEAKALRKAFISIKGLYFQADVQGQTVTWLVPHERGQPPPSDVDFAVMATFLEFYTTLMGFTNFALYQSIGLFYPPKLTPPTKTEEGTEEEDEETASDTKTAEQEAIESLGRPLARSAVASNEGPEPDDFDMEGMADPRTAAEAERIKRLPTLFVGFRVFLNREVPKEPLVLILRACGAEVSWEGAGSTFPVDDPKITHHIVDRPSLKQKDLNRTYLQPQWVFDSLNAGLRLPMEEYYPGAVLPPHLSPFVEEEAGDYVPPERLAILKAQGVDVSALQEVHEAAEAELAPPAPKKPKPKEEEKGVPVVKEGDLEKKPHPQAAKNVEGEERKLRESMIRKKHRRVYHKITQGKKRHVREAKALAKKRKMLESS